MNTLLVLCLLACVACAPAAGLAPAAVEAGATLAEVQAPAAAEPKPNPWAEPMRELLLPHCGSCHLPGRPTSVPLALLVFDLTETPWHARLSGEQFQGIEQRVLGKLTVEADRQLVADFVRCAVLGCP